MILKDEIKRLKTARKNAASKQKKLLGEAKEHARRIKRIDRQIEDLLRKSRVAPGPPQSYSEARTWKKKILFLLSDQELTLSEIIAQLANREKNLNTEKIYWTVQKTLLRLVDALEILKIGQHNSKYKLNVKTD